MNANELTPEIQNEAHEAMPVVRDEDAGSREWDQPVKKTAPAMNDHDSLLAAAEVDDLQSRWNAIQIEFVDDPQSSVRQADELVSDALERIKQAFSDRRMLFDGDAGEDVSTEEMRVALQGYRDYLERLLTV